MGHFRPIMMQKVFIFKIMQTYLKLMVSVILVFWFIPFYLPDYVFILLYQQHLEERNCIFCFIAT